MMIDVNDPNSNAARKDYISFLNHRTKPLNLINHLSNQIHKSKPQ